MSKAVKRVGRAIGKVVKGVSKVFSKVGGLAKGLTKSKFGRVVLMAAAIYFGGAALMGGISGMGAGGAGFLSGAGTGISNAWTGLLNAGSSALGGEFATAGSQLSAGFQGAAYAPAATAPGTSAGTMAAFGPAPEALASGIQSGAGMPMANSVAGSPLLSAPTAMTAAAPAGAAPTAANSLWNSAFMNSYGGAAAIMGGSQLAGGLISGAGQQKALDDQRAYEEKAAADQRARYNANVGTSLWGDPTTQDPGYGYGAGLTPQTPDYRYDQPGQPALLQPRGLIASQFPTYKRYGA
jgi:hypothetical protein